MEGDAKPDDVLELKSRLSERLLELRTRAAPLLAEIKNLEQRLELIEQLLKLSTVDAIQMNPPFRVQAPGGKESVADIAAKVLGEAGVPLHISELRRRYLSSGVQLPGKGTEANLISYLVRDRRFVRVSKGTYALAQQASQTVPARTRARQKRRRRNKPSRATEGA